MKTFSIITLGCKVNQYESQQVRQLLETLGLRQLPTDRPADLTVVNTCCVTHFASAKSRQAIRKIRRHRPASFIVITGCLPAGPGDEMNTLHTLDDNTTIVSQKDRLAQTLTQLVLPYQTARRPFSPADQPNLLNKTQKHQKIKPKNNLTQHNHNEVFPDSQYINLNLPTLSVYSRQTRAFLKVQDGCDAFCSYCIIPKIRTKVCSKDQTSVINEAKTLVTAGHKEIVLTGICLGAYGRDTARRKKWDTSIKNPLADLVDKIAQVPGLTRLRLSSLEPGDVTQSLLDTLCKYDNIALHLHLPLQSGSEKILRKMCRQYTVEQYLTILEKVRKRLDHPAITTDIIVGFPGETDMDFEASMSVARQAGFSKIHVFSFSPRPTTPAAAMKPAIPPDVIRNRSRTLRGLDTALQKKFRKLFVGKKVSIIIESDAPLQGRAERYFTVKYSDLKPSPGCPANPRINDLVTGVLVR